MKKMFKKYYILTFFIAISFLSGCIKLSDKLNTESELLYPKSRRTFWNYEQDGVIFSSAMIPVYDVGDAFLYDNGELDIVKSVDGNYIKWFRPDNSHFIAHQNPFLPYIEEVLNDGAEGKTVIENHYKMKDNFLWPLKVGLYDELEVKEVRSDNKFLNQFDYKWSCLVTGDETINIDFNKYDVFKVKCEKQRFSKTYETQFLYYSPEIKHFAKKVILRSTAPDQIANIVSYGLMPNALPEKLQKSLSGLVQYALETRISGNNIIKKDQDVLMKITPIKTVETNKGYFCREYKQELTARGRHSTQNGLACKDDKGLWKTPAP